MKMLKVVDTVMVAGTIYKPGAEVATDKLDSKHVQQLLAAGVVLPMTFNGGDKEPPVSSEAANATAAGSSQSLPVPAHTGADQTPTPTKAPAKARTRAPKKTT